MIAAKTMSLSPPTITIAGNNFAISGSPNTGDTFSISKNSSGTTDARNAALTQALFELGSQLLLDAIEPLLVAAGAVRARGTSKIQRTMQGGGGAA